jgi:hypothetical protein
LHQTVRLLTVCADILSGVLEMSRPPTVCMPFQA